MARYADDLLLVDARSQYFSANGLGDGGYTARWVKTLLQITVGDVRKKLRLDQEPPRPTAPDWIAFGLWVLLNLTTLCLTLLICSIPLWLMLTRMV